MFEERLRGFEFRKHVAKLLPDDRLRDQWFPEGLPHMGPDESLFNDMSCTS